VAAYHGRYTATALWSLLPHDFRYLQIVEPFRWVMVRDRTFELSWMNCTEEVECLVGYCFLARGIASRARLRNYGLVLFEGCCKSISEKKPESESANIHLLAIRGETAQKAFKELCRAGPPKSDTRSSQLFTSSASLPTLSGLASSPRSSSYSPTSNNKCERLAPASADDDADGEG
jgi:hypothetical protein